jgi:WD40 repeat protein
VGQAIDGGRDNQRSAGVRVGKEGETSPVKMPSLSLVLSLGYGGEPLHYCGGSSVLYANGNVVKRVTWEGGEVSSTNMLASGLGVGALAMHPQHTHLVMAERGHGAAVSLYAHSQDGFGEHIDNFAGAGSIDMNSMHFSDDGNSLVTVSALPDFKVSVWDWERNRQTPIATSKAPGEVKQCAFNPENPFQLALCGGGALHICNIVKGSSEQLLELEFIPVQPTSSDVAYVSMAWSTDGRLFATTSDSKDGANLWSINLQEYRVEGDSAVISQNPIECHLLSGPEHLICWCSDGSVVWVGFQTMTEGHRINMPLSTNETLVSACLAEGPYGKLFLGTSSGSMYVLEVRRRMPDGSFDDDEEEPSAVSLKDPDCIVGEVQSCSHHALKRIAITHGAHINAICPANSGDAIASAGRDGSVIIWDTASGIPLAAQRLGRAVMALSAHPYEPLLALGDGAGFVYVLDIGMPSRVKCKFSVRLFRGEGVGGASFNDDGSLLAVTPERSNVLYIIALKDKAFEVHGYMEFPLQGSFVQGNVRWAGSRHVVVGDSGGALLACTDVPGKDGDSLALKAVFTGLKVPGVAAFCVSGGQVVVASGSDKKVVAYEAKGWARVITADDVPALHEAPASAQWPDPDKRVQALSALPAGEIEMVAMCGADGAVSLRGAGGKVEGVLRVNSLWTGGSSAVTIFKKDGKTTVVACGGCNGSVNILSTDPQQLKGRGLGVASAATTVSQRLLDHIGAEVENSEEQGTHAEIQRLEDEAAEIAINAAKKNTFREAVRKQKAALDALLQANAGAPEIERIAREEIVVDRALREQIIADGDARVLATKERILRENKAKEVQVSRIKTLAWQSMDVHGSELRAFQMDVGVFNYPIQKMTEDEEAQLKVIKMQRRMELAALSLQHAVLGEAHSLVYLDDHNIGPEQLDKALAAEGTPADAGPVEGDAAKQEMTEEENEEAWRARQHEPLMYHRLEVTTRERKTAQLLMLQQVIRKIKAGFNGTFEDYLKKKGQSLGRAEEKMSRLLEINKELKSAEPIDKIGLADSEQPEKVLAVEDSEITVEKWVSPAEIRAREEEERRQREAAGKDDTAERALNQMMGGSLAGQSAIGKLEQVMEKPEHLIPKEGEELLEEQVKELKEWEAAYKKFEDEKETYRRALDAEAKKLKMEMMEECKKFDESLQELAAVRMETDYKVYELELYKIKLMQAIAQEEEDVLVQRSLKQALRELSERRQTAEDALKEYRLETEKVEGEVESIRGEGVVLEKQFIKEVVKQVNAQDKELGEHVLEAYRKRSDMLELGLPEDLQQLVDQHIQRADEHDAAVGQHQANLDAMDKELQRLVGAAEQVYRQIEAAEAELETLESHMGTANTNLDVTLSVKQGQLEVEQAAVVTDFTDAVVLEKAAIEAHNTAITTRGDDKIAVLQEIKDFRKGIHGLQWDDQRLDLEEEDMMQRTKDLQLLRVTKSLQTIIKGGDGNRDAIETANLDKLISYQTTVHKGRVAEKLKAVQLLQAQARGCHKENVELDEDILYVAPPSVSIHGPWQGVRVRCYVLCPCQVAQAPNEGVRALLCAMSMRAHALLCAMPRPLGLVACLCCCVLCPGPWALWPACVPGPWALWPACVLALCNNNSCACRTTTLYPVCKSCHSPHSCVCSALESAVVERQRLCDLQGTKTQPRATTTKSGSKTASGPPPRNPKVCLSPCFRALQVYSASLHALHDSAPLPTTRLRAVFARAIPLTCAACPLAPCAGGCQDEHDGDSSKAARFGESPDTGD